MKKVGLLLLALAATAGLVSLTSSADARPQYRDGLYGKYKVDKADKEHFLVNQACNSCHYGKSKKQRNDFGKALIKGGLTKDSYTKLKSDKPALAKHVKEVLEKVLKEKNEAGETYDSRVKAKKKPGTAPK